MKKLLANWWFRALLFLVPTTSFYYLVKEYTTYSGNIIETQIFLFLLFVSLFIESFRAGSNAIAFGFQLDRFMLIDIFKGLILVINANLLFLLVGYIYGYKLVPEITNLSEISNKLLYVAYFILIKSAIEEVFFRGIIFQALREKFGDFISVISVSLGFSLFHFYNPSIDILAFINIFLAGILLSVLYITTESLWLPLSFHFFWNFNQSLFFGSNISGLNFDISIFTATFINSENSFLFGNEFGIESGFLTTLCLTILVFISFIYERKNPFIMAVKFKRKYEESKLLNT